MNAQKMNNTQLTLVGRSVPNEYTDTSNLPKMKTLKEMAELTGLSYTALRNLCMEKKIVHIRAGKKYLVNYDRFVDYLNGVGGA